MPCQASAKTGVIVAQLCWYTVPYVSSSYAACIHARYVRVYARTNAHACMHACVFHRWKRREDGRARGAWRGGDDGEMYTDAIDTKPFARSARFRPRDEEGVTEDRCQPVIAWIDDYHALDTTK